MLSLWIYIVIFGWKLAVVVMLLLLAHELGHYFAFRAYGLPARLPAFVPLLGAFTAGALPEDLEQDAYIALAGPLVGLGLAAVCYAIGDATQDRFWYACADLSAFLNLFNMIPMPPFDGGRIIGALWPPLWIVGFVALHRVCDLPAHSRPVRRHHRAAWVSGDDLSMAGPRRSARAAHDVRRARAGQPLVSRNDAGTLLRDGAIASDRFTERARTRRVVTREWLLAIACASLPSRCLQCVRAQRPGPFLRDFEAYWAAGLGVERARRSIRRRNLERGANVSGRRCATRRGLAVRRPAGDAARVGRSLRDCRTRSPRRYGRRCSPALSFCSSPPRFAAAAKSSRVPSVSRALALASALGP